MVWHANTTAMLNNHGVNRRSAATGWCSDTRIWQQSPQNPRRQQHILDWINGGFFVLDPQVLNKIPSDSTLWEQEPLQNLSNESQLKAYLHTGFWQPMDTLREKNDLDEIWRAGKAPWKMW